MSILRSLGHILTRKTQAPGKDVKPFRTKTPLDLHQNTGVEVDATMKVLHEVSGGYFPEFDTTQIVVAVGRMTHSGREWYRSYLSGGKSFIETVADTADRSKSVQTRLWAEEREIIPSTPEQWKDLLNDQDGLVGWSGFQLDAMANRPAIVYGRAWSPGGAQRVKPIEVTEVVTDTAGGSVNLRHRMMLYSRPLNGGGAEYLLADVVEGPEGASLDIHVGVDISNTQVQIFPAGMGQ